MQITVNIQAPELAQAILSLADTLGGKGLTIASPSQPATQPSCQEAPPVTPQYQQPTNAVPTAPPGAPYPPVQPQAYQSPAQLSFAVPTAPAPTYTLEQLGTAGAALMAAGKQQDLINLLQQFGVPALTSLSPEQYSAFATALRGLGAQI